MVHVVLPSMILRSSYLDFACKIFSLALGQNTIHNLMLVGPICNGWTLIIFKSISTAAFPLRDVFNQISMPLMCRICSRTFLNLVQYNDMNDGDSILYILRHYTENSI